MGKTIVEFVVVNEVEGQKKEERKKFKYDKQFGGAVNFLNENFHISWGKIVDSRTKIEELMLWINCSDLTRIALENQNNIKRVIYHNVTE